MWLGSNHPNLIVLLLRSNCFLGSIPSHLCHLIHLQVLDLALNQISRSIYTNMPQKYYCFDFEMDSIFNHQPLLSKPRHPKKLHF